jgi:hypothetical protein
VVLVNLDIGKRMAFAKLIAVMDSTKIRGPAGAAFAKLALMLKTAITPQ